MNTLKKIISFVLLVILFACISTFVNAQNYKTGIGVRLGGLSSGLTFRGFVNSNSAIEGIAGFGQRSFVMTGLYERFNPVNNAPGLQWFYGGGAHLGFFRYGGYYYTYKDHGHYYVIEEGDHATVFGVDFIFGMDYKFNNAPINIGLDLKPFVDFHDGAIGYFDGAFNFRFVF